jgi:hypothetical protein
VRVTPDTGLVYVSATPHTGRLRALQRGPRRQAVPARPAAARDPPALTAAVPRTLLSPERASAAAVGPRGIAAAAAAAAAAKAARAAPETTPGLKDSGWVSVAAPAPGLPLSAVGTLDMVDSDGWWVGCTGAVFALHAVVTAAVSGLIVCGVMAAVECTHMTSVAPSCLCQTVFYLHCVAVLIYQVL